MLHLSVSEAARRLGAKPRDISDLLYKRQLRDDLCPIVAGRRLIPATYLDMIARALRRAGRTLVTPSITIATEKEHAFVQEGVHE